jgi:hypothetical protein
MPFRRDAGTCGRPELAASAPVFAVEARAELGEAGGCGNDAVFTVADGASAGLCVVAELAVPVVVGVSLWGAVEVAPSLEAVSSSSSIRYFAPSGSSYWPLRTVHTKNAQAIAPSASDTTMRRPRIDTRSGT